MDAGEAWPPDTAAVTECARCNAHVSPAYARQWADNDGTLRGCPQCLPRSVRFGEDVYDRDPDDIEHEKDDPNRRAKHGGVPRSSAPQRDSK